MLYVRCYILHVTCYMLYVTCYVYTYVHIHIHTFESQVMKKVPPKRGAGLHTQSVWDIESVTDHISESMTHSFSYFSFRSDWFLNRYRTHTHTRHQDTLSWSPAQPVENRSMRKGERWRDFYRRFRRDLLRRFRRMRSGSLRLCKSYRHWMILAKIIHVEYIFVYIGSTSYTPTRMRKNKWIWKMSFLFVSHIELLLWRRDVIFWCFSIENTLVNYVDSTRTYSSMHILCSRSLSNSVTLVDRLAAVHFSAVLRVQNVSAFSIQLCWRAAARAGSSFCGKQV